MSIVREIFYRIPAGILAVVYCVPLVYWLNQLDEILQSSSFSLGYGLLAFALPMILVGSTHLAFISSKVTFRPWLDVPLVALPVPLFSGWLLRADRGNLLVAILLGLIATVAIVGLAQLTARRSAVLRWPLGVLAAIIFAAALGLTLARPVDFPLLVGSAAIVIVGLGVISIAATALQVNGIVGGVLLAIFALTALLYPPRYDIRSLPVQGEDTQTLPSPLVGGALHDWLFARQDRQAYSGAHRPYPVFISASPGGGISAAAMSYEALSNIAAYCPQFAQHLFAAVGVSGGSFGVALYAAGVSGKLQVDGGHHCGAGQASARPELVADHLAPVLAALFFAETVEVLLPVRFFKYDAAEALELSFRSSDPRVSTFLDNNFRNTWSAEGVTPALVLASTRVRRNTPFLFSPITPSLDTAGGEWAGDEQLPMNFGMRTVTAAATSARFPWLAPTAQLVLSPEISRLLVDGGYYDNSGTTVALSFFREIEDDEQAAAACVSDQPSCPPWVSAQQGQAACPVVIESDPGANVEWKGCEIHVYLAVINIGTRNDDAVPKKDDDDGGSSVLDPVRALLGGLNEKSAEATAILQRYVADRGGAHGFPKNGLYSFEFPEELKLPFGWNISPAKERSIKDSIVVPADAQACGSPETASMGCQILRIAALLEPTAGSSTK